MGEGHEGTRARARLEEKVGVFFVGGCSKGAGPLLFVKLFIFGNRGFFARATRPMLPPGTRFVNTRTWTIDINAYGSNFFEVYHVVSSTPKSMLLMTATLFRGNVDVDGNKLMDKLLDARATNTPILNESTAPRRFMLKKDDRGDYFVEGKGTASRRVRLNGTYPVTYIAHGITDKRKVDNDDVSRKRSRVEAETEW